MADPVTPTDAYGVSETLSGYTIESCNITKSPRREEVHNQQNAVTKEIRYDTRKELRLTMRGASEPADTTITIGSQQFIVDSVEKAGTYNGLQRWNVTGHSYTNCNSETAAS